MSEPLVVVLEGSISRTDVAALCSDLVERLSRGGAPVVVCDVGGLRRADAVVVDALARLQLTARRQGSRVVLRDASADLSSLLALAGLVEVVPVCPDGDCRSAGTPGSGVEVVREAEQLEQPRVDEVRDPDDPSL